MPPGLTGLNDQEPRVPSLIRVLVVDDSALIRQMLTRALALDPRIDIVATAKTGVEAVELARTLEPDVITLDIEMPELSGLEAIPLIRRYSTARIVMLSSVNNPDTTYLALSMGAVDFMAKPSAGVASSLSELADTLIKKIKMAYRITPAHVDQVQHAIEEREQPSAPTKAQVREAEGTVVALAASTGGPPALERVFSGLLGALPASYVIVQHLPAGFSASLAKRLSSAGGIPVVEAVDGALLEPGRAYLAPYGLHLLVGKDAEGRNVLRRVDDPPVHGVRPAADPLFESVARTFGERGIGVVLTGMGADGALGAVRIRQRGGRTIVQDAATSVVWGMPGATVRMGAADRVVPLGMVAAEIRRALHGAGERAS